MGWQKFPTGQFCGIFGLASEAWCQCRTDDDVHLHGKILWGKKRSKEEIMAGWLICMARLRVMERDGGFEFFPQ